MSNIFFAISKLLDCGSRLLTSKFLYTDKLRCKQCKGNCQYDRSFLYLLPSFLDDEHVEGVEYYIENAVPLEDETQIPAGRRSCSFNVSCCESCGCRYVAIVDFLQVRDSQLVKGIENCSYAEVEEFLRDRW